MHVQLCQSIVCYNHYLAKEYHKEKLLNNVYCFVVVFFLQFKQLQRVVTMALKSLYRVCEIKKLDLIFSSFSVRSQNYSYKNSMSLGLVAFVLKHITSLYFLYLLYMFGRYVCHLYFDPRVFVLVRWSTPSQIALNRILWFIDQYPYHPRN